MQQRDFAHKCKPQTHAAHLPASGFVHTKERFKDVLHAILRNPASSVGNLQNHIFVCLLHRNEDRSARLVVFDGIFDQIKQQTINQRVAADHADFLTVLPERNLFFLREWREICQNFLRERRERDLVCSRYGLQIAHRQQGTDKRAQPIQLFHLKSGHLHGFRICVRVFLTKKLQLCLHEG